MKFMVALLSVAAVCLASETPAATVSLPTVAHIAAPYPYLLPTIATAKEDQAAQLPVVAYNYAPYYHSAPVVVPAPVAPVASQFNSGDEFANFNYGYANVNSAKQEAGNGYLGVTGGYQYVDANGQLQTVSYAADGLGFRTIDSRLQKSVEAIVEPPVFDGKSPEPVEETAEVVLAREEFQKAFEEVQSRTRRESDPAISYGYNGALPFYTSSFYNPYSRPLLAYRYPYSFGYSFVY